jgi:GNAT superfamily N-acetyltransferase
MDIEIRQAGRDDIPTLVTIIGAAFKQAADRLGLPLPKGSKHASNITGSWISADMDKGVRYFIAEENDRGVGAATLGFAKPDACYIGRLSVLPEYQGRGLGRKILTYAIDLATETDSRYISIGVVSDEQHLLDWYKRMGFTVNRRVNYDDFPFEVTMMRRDLRGK